MAGRQNDPIFGQHQFFVGFLVQREEAAVDMEFNLDPAIAELKEQEPV